MEKPKCNSIEINTKKLENSNRGMSEKTVHKSKELAGIKSGHLVGATRAKCALHAHPPIIPRG